MNFKQTMMCLSLLGLASQVMVAGEGYRPVPGWYANPYYFTTDAYDVGGKVCGHAGSALGEIGKAAKETGSFISEYPKSTAFTSIVATLTALWFIRKMYNYYNSTTSTTTTITTKS